MPPRTTHTPQNQVLRKAVMTQATHTPGRSAPHIRPRSRKHRVVGPAVPTIIAPNGPAQLALDPVATATRQPRLETCPVALNTVTSRTMSKIITIL